MLSNSQENFDTKQNTDHGKIFRWCNRVSLGWIIRDFYLGMALMKSMAWETLQTFFPLFRTVIKVFKVFTSCLRNEAVNHLKANFVYWKATRVSLDYTHCFAVCAHFERHLGLLSTRRNFQRGMIFSFVFWHPLFANFSLNKENVAPPGKFLMVENTISMDYGIKNQWKCLSF